MIRNLSRPRTRQAAVFRLLLPSLAMVSALHARPPVLTPALAHSSANYSITAGITEGGGRPASSAAYSQSASVGAIAGTANVASPSETAKNGFLGQIYNVTGFQLNAPGTTVNENGTIQLTGNATLDDATRLALPASAVTFSVVGGPIVSVTYAGDGIDDAWQVQYFGAPPNPNAGPLVDYDGTGQNNLFKYLAGLDPLDPTSRFVLSVAEVPGQPGQKQLMLTPVFGGHVYTVQTASSLTQPAWTTLTTMVSSDNGTTRTVTDTGAAAAPRFYRVLVSYP